MRNGQTKTGRLGCATANVYYFSSSEYPLCHPRRKEYSYVSHEKAATDGRSAAHVVVGSDDGVLYGRPTDSTRPGSKSIAANSSNRLVTSRRAQFQKILIFFPVTTPSDIKPSKGPAHGRHASACQFRLLYV